MSEEEYFISIPSKQLTVSMDVERALRVSFRRGIAQNPFYMFGSLVITIVFFIKALHSMGINSAFIFYIGIST
jgi:hypothetical protein